MAKTKRRSRPGSLPAEGSIEALQFSVDQEARFRRIAELAAWLRSKLTAPDRACVDELERLAREGEHWWDRAQRTERALLRAQIMKKTGQQGRANRMLGISRPGAPSAIPENAAAIFHRLVTQAGSLEIIEQGKLPRRFTAAGLPCDPEDAVRRMAAEWDVDDETLISHLREDHKALLDELESGQFLEFRTGAETRAIVRSLERLPKLPWSTER